MSENTNPPTKRNGRGRAPQRRRSAPDPVAGSINKPTRVGDLTLDYDRMGVWCDGLFVSAEEMAAAIKTLKQDAGPRLAKGTEEERPAAAEGQAGTP